MHAAGLPGQPSRHRGGQPMTHTETAAVANSIMCELGEGPVWDPIRRQLLWIDIQRGAVHVGELDSSGRVTSVGLHLFDGTVGAVAVAVDGSWVVAGAHQIFRYVHGRPGEGVTVISSSEPRRTNDGKPDPAGRFVIGTLAVEGASSTEVLVRMDADGVTTLDEDLTLSNGLAWSGDAATMYSIDTLRRRVYARDYDAVSGAVGERRTHLQIEDGYPDGICLDAEEHLWVAVWGSGQVRRYSPTGELEAVITVPAPHVSSVAFAGDGLDTLIITTATQDLTVSQMSTHPLSGQLFSFKPDVPGLPVALWNGHLPDERTEIR